MRESQIEQYLTRRVKSLGGEVRKLQWINRRHAPDRLVLYKGVHFVELKRPGGAARAGQAREHKRIRQQGAVVWVISTREQVDAFISGLQTL